MSGFHLLQFHVAGEVAERLIDLSMEAGGVLVAGDPALDPDPSTAGIFVRGADGHLLNFQFVGVGPWRVRDLSADVEDRMVEGRPVVHRDDEILSVFVRGTDGHLLQFLLSGGGPWAFHDLSSDAEGRRIAGNPTVHSDNGVLSVFARGIENELLQFYYTGDGWLAADLSDDSGGQQIAGDPIVDRDGDALSVFVRGIHDELLRFNYTGSGPWAAQDLSDDAGGVPIAGDPVVHRDAGALSVFARGVDGDLLEFHFTGEARWLAIDVSDDAGGVPIAGNPVFQPGDDAWRVFARGISDELWEFRLPGKPPWQTSDLGGDVGGVPIAGDPAVMVGDGAVNVFARGLAAGSVSPDREGIGLLALPTSYPIGRRWGPGNLIGRNGSGMRDDDGGGGGKVTVTILRQPSVTLRTGTPVHVDKNSPFSVVINADPGSVEIKQSGEPTEYDDAVQLTNAWNFITDTGYHATQAGLTAPLNVQFPREGKHVAHAHVDGTPLFKEVHYTSDSPTVTYIVDRPTPTMQAPTDRTFSVPEAGLTLNLQVTTTKADWWPGLKVTASDGVNPVPATLKPDSASPTVTTWTGTFPLNPMPLGPRTLTITATCVIDGLDVSVTTSVALTIRDGQGPAVNVSPTRSAEVRADATHPCTIVGTCVDNQSGMIGGQASFETALSSAGPWTAATTAQPGDYRQWTAQVTPPSLGAFTVYLRATDRDGQQTPLEWPLVAISDDTPATLADRLGPVEYLAQLVEFARDHVTVGSANLTTKNLTDALDQPIDRLADPGSVPPAANLPINELRIPCEVLSRRIRRNNVPTAPGGRDEARYRQTAYETALLSAGTSFTELRLARGADDANRQALAERLGITLYSTPGAGRRHDQLDALTLTGDQLTDEALETLFGIQRIEATLDPLRLPAPSALFTWQVTTQTTTWRVEDGTPPSPPNPRAYDVLVDPDVITASDILPDSEAAARITGLLTDRAKELDDKGRTLQAAAAGSGTATDRFGALLEAGIPGANVDTLTGWRDSEQRGDSITASLSDAGLDRAGYLCLLSIHDLTGLADLSDAEWDDTVQVLLGAYRRRTYATWRGQETGLVLSPDSFTDSGRGPEPSSLRISPRARDAWTRTLAKRTSQRQTLLDSAATLISTAESAALPHLRDALKADLAVGFPGTDIGAKLSRLYQIDVEASGTQATTWLRQATASVQTLLQLLRAGDVDPDAPEASWTLKGGDAVTFDDAWVWMSSLGSWRNATTGFLFPETILNPAVFTGATSAFKPLRDALSRSAGGSENAVTDALATYWTAVGSALKQVPHPPVTALPAALDVARHDRQRQTVLLDWSRAQTSLNLALEAFWATPLLAAKRLAADGHFQAALDWMWVVFPYNDPQAPSGSATIHNEALTTPSAPDLTQGPDWTLRLTPFDLANGRPAPYLRYTLLTLATILLGYGDSEFADNTEASRAHAIALYERAQAILAHPRLQPVQPFNLGEGTYELPPIAGLRIRATAQLAKLRQGRDIAGLPRTVPLADTNGIPMRQPTPYRFRILHTRAVQMTQQATALEAQYLSLLEKHDTDELKFSDALFAAGLAKMQVNVAEARVQESVDSAAAASIQTARAEAMVETYTTAMNAPPNQYESALLDQYGQMRDLQNMLSIADAALTIGQAAVTGISGAASSFGGSIAAAGIVTAGAYIKTGMQTDINNLQAQMQANQLCSGQEERRRQLALQVASAQQDVKVAQAQQTVADDRLQITRLETQVAEAQSAHVAATLALLSKQFTTAELYLWMSDVIGSIYRYFLQQATATARLAEEQLAFERVEATQGLIANDYWAPPTTTEQDGKQVIDRRGMTGAERLAQDLSRLDEYSFSTDQRRLNISHTFSLAQMLPVEFLQFRRTGTLSFGTPEAWFDQDLPGCYQRLIRQVHLTLVALVPPNRGIRGTLSSPGLSQVVTVGEFGTYTPVTLRRDPATIVVTAPLNANGVFPLDLQPDLVLPFEGAGVDTQWAFDLPHAANPFDYGNIADLLFTLDYTALRDSGYATIVRTRLNKSLSRSSDVLCSLTRDFPDQWYQMCNPPASSTVPGAPAPPRRATLTVPTGMFPTGITEITTAHIGLRLVPTNDTDASNGGELAGRQITLTRVVEGADLGGTAQTDLTGIVSTRRGANTWATLAGATPVGQWNLELDSDTAELLDRGALADIAVAITWQGTSPAWPT